MKKEIIINDHKWEFVQNEIGYYNVLFYEYYSSCGWKFLSKDENYTKEAIEFMQSELLEG